MLLLAGGGGGGISQSHKRRNGPATDDDDNTNKRKEMVPGNFFCLGHWWSNLAISSGKAKVTFYSKKEPVLILKSCTNLPTMITPLLVWHLTCCSNRERERERKGQRAPLAVWKLSNNRKTTALHSPPDSTEQRGQILAGDNLTSTQHHDLGGKL